MDNDQHKPQYLYFVHGNSITVYAGLRHVTTNNWVLRGSGLPGQIPSFLPLWITICIRGHENVFSATDFPGGTIYPVERSKKFLHYQDRVRLKTINSFQIVVSQSVRSQTSWFTTTIDTKQYIIKDIGFQIYLEYILYVWMYFFQ